MFEYPVVYVDIETTGGSYRNSRVLEVAAIRVENGEVTKEFCTLINPESYIPRSITTLTGIAEADITDAPIFNDVADELIEVLDGAIFIAHNVRFDYSFLKQEFANVGISLTPKLLCTVRLSRALYSSQKGHSLAKLIERHEIPVLDRHRALEDARAILYFSQLAFDEHGYDLFNEAVNKQLKTQSLPPNLEINEIDTIKDTAGVYIFRDEVKQPIYVGKSITLKKRIMSHFQSTTSKEIKISQNVHHVETIETGSELAALILESKLIKELKPLYNRMLRRITQYAMIIRSDNNEYTSLFIQSGNIDNETNLSKIYGVYTNRVKAKKTIDEITRLFQLCPKLMGLEKSNGSCFSYSLGKCRGACIGKEDATIYNRRFELALERSKISEWAYGGPIVVPVNNEGEKVILDKWMIQGFVDEEGLPIINDVEPAFDVDEYKIIKRFIRENRQFIQTYSPS